MSGRKFHDTRLFRSSGSGFTLIELLVVIAIISLLMSIMLPVLGNARESARRIQCAAAVRQINMGAITYSDGNKGYMPLTYAANMPGDPVPSVNWIRRLAVSGFAPETAWLPANPTNKAFLCPSSQVKLGNDVVTHFGHYGTNIMVAGAINWDMVNNKPLSSSIESIPLYDRRLNRLSSTIGFFDSGGTYLNWFYGVTNPNATASSAMYLPGGTMAANGFAAIPDPTMNRDAIQGRHVGKTVNVAWLDGHVTTTPTTFFDPEPAPRHVEFRKYWTGQF